MTIDAATALRGYANRADHAEIARAVRPHLLRALHGADG